MNFKLITIPAALTLGLVALAGCGSSGSDADPATKTTQTQTTPMPSDMTTDQPSDSTPTSDSMGGMGDMVMVDIKDFMYEGDMSVDAGQMIMVTNDDSEAHTLTSDESGLFAVTVQPGKTAMFDAPTKAGSYAYHCDFHANMHGTLKVS
jgi:plastocyanin